MIKLILLCVLSSTLSFSTPADHGYTVSQGTEKITESEQTAIDAVNWDRYRMQTIRRTIKFENGFEIELWSAKEMKAANLPFQEDKIITDNSAPKSNPIFRITPTGHIIESHTYTKKK